MPRLKRRHCAVGFALLWIAAAVATHIPVPKLPQTAPGDKLMHFVGYFVLAFCFAFTMRKYKCTLLRATIVPAILLAIYGALDEITQPLVNRHCSLHDWYADVAGISAGLIVYVILSFAGRIFFTPRFFDR